MANGMKRTAIILLSGGLDSTTVLAIAKAQGFALHALSFDYGQRHAIELEAAKRVAAIMGVERHTIVPMDLRVFGGSSLTADIAVPKHDSVAEMDVGIPITYVPARNIIFLSYALACAEVACAGDIFLGVNAIDYSGYPDCRPDFIAAFEQMANKGVAAAVEGNMPIKLHTPLITMSKAEIIKEGLRLGVDYGQTHSCYDPAPNGEACGQCDSCLLRAKGFEEAGAIDPVIKIKEA